MQFGKVYIYFLNIIFRHLKNYVVIKILGHELICIPWCNSIKFLSVVIIETEMYD